MTRAELRDNFMFECVSPDLADQFPHWWTVSLVPGLIQITRTIIRGSCYTVEFRPDKDVYPLMNTMTITPLNAAIEPYQGFGFLIVVWNMPKDIGECVGFCNMSTGNASGLSFTLNNALTDTLTGWRDTGRLKKLFSAKKSVI